MLPGHDFFGSISKQIMRLRKEEEEKKSKISSDGLENSMKDLQI